MSMSPVCNTTWEGGVWVVQCGSLSSILAEDLPGKMNAVASTPCFESSVDRPLIFEFPITKRFLMVSLGDSFVG